jgi:hypothetical protein
MVTVLSWLEHFSESAATNGDLGSMDFFFQVFLVANVATQLMYEVA